jgi:hypothetical protein
VALFALYFLYIVFAYIFSEKTRKNIRDKQWLLDLTGVMTGGARAQIFQIILC